MWKPSLREDLELKRVGSRLWKWDPCANHIPPTSNLITYTITPNPAHSALCKSAKLCREMTRQKEKLIHWVWTVCPSRCMCSTICKFNLMRSDSTTDLQSLCLHVTCDSPSYDKFSQTAQSKIYTHKGQRITWFHQRSHTTENQWQNMSIKRKMAERLNTPRVQTPFWLFYQEC